MGDAPIDGVGSPEKDRIALLKLFEATGGRSTWNEHSGWGEDTDIGTWKGVEASNGRVQTLKLPENNLIGPIPPQLGDLTEMYWLDLALNKLTGSIPEELGLLINLTQVALYENKLTGPIPPQLGDLTEMTELNLGHNRLTGGIPKELANLGRLERLYIDSNLLSGSIPEELGRLVNLVDLTLYGNKLTGEIPKTLGNAKGLRMLLLNRNSLSGDMLKELCDAEHLQSFTLDHDSLSGVTPHELTKLDNLEEISIDGNPTLRLHPEFRFERSVFHRWALRRGLIDSLKLIEVGEAVDTGSTSDHEKQPLPFPSKVRPGALAEAPVSTKEHDCLHFTAYAEAIAEHLRTSSAWPVGVGIFAQWGAGKSSLLQLILAELGKTDIESKRTRRDWCRHLLLRFGACSVPQALFQRGRTHPEQDRMGADEEDPLIDSAAGTITTEPKLTCIFASFDAWLFADSDVLWAVLVSEIFKQVESHHCFGTGAVRLARVQQAVDEFSCMDWCVALLAAFSFAGVAAIAVWLGGEIGDLHGVSERAAAWFGLAGVPLVMVIYAIKSLPMVFRGQGGVILSEAQSMGDSVGSAHLGFMGQVRDEMKVLLGMIKAKCTDREQIVLVVSIDNLDRCPHRQIVKVLEAAHLLLEQNEANVILLLALDPRIVIAAIEADMDEAMRQEVSGSEYLDKIIHLPFCIPIAANKDRLRLVNRWLNHADNRTQRDNAHVDHRPDPSVSGGRDGAGQRDDAEMAGDDAALSAVSHQGSGGLLSDMQPPTATANQSPRARDREDAKEGTGETYEDDISPQNDEVDRGNSGDHAGEGAEEDGRRVPSDSLVTRTASPGQGEEKSPLSPQLPTPTRTISPRAGGDQDAWREDSEADPGGGNDADSAISTHGDGDRLVPPKTHRLGLMRAVSTLTHTSMEMDELNAFMSMVGTTPRKAKRVCNIYSVQRSLARKTMLDSFTQDDARKILRWTILSEFWPFRSACIIGCIDRETHQRSEASKTNRIISVYDLYRSRVEKEIITRMIGQPRAHAPTVAGDNGVRVASDWMHERNSYEMPGARKLLGMDESDYAILRVLKSAPPILVEDFDEDKLGLVGLSFNLNPALVAKVAGWTRSCWDMTD